MASVWQNTMIALARCGWLTRAAQRAPWLSAAARQFVGGPDEDSALRAAIGLRQQGIRASLFFLGEYIPEEAMTLQTVDSLVRLLPCLNPSGLDTHISVDPTQIGYSISRDLGDKNALRLAAAYPAQRSNRSFLMVDMEDHTFVDCTLGVRRLLAGRGIPAAITLQSYLRRTESDMRSLIAERCPCVRLVKGAFSAPASIAFQPRSEIDESYLRLARLMLSDEARQAGLYPVFATHDEALIDAIRGLAGQAVPPATRPVPDAPAQAGETACPTVTADYEFEMLYGVRPDLQARILADGDRLRLYVPYGTHWWPYTIRRVGENPRNLAFVLRALKQAGRR